MKTLKLSHYSGSTLGDFIERPDSFYRRKIQKVEFAINPSMARGKAIEDVINYFLKEDEILDVHELFEEHLKGYEPKSDKDKEKLEKIRASLLGLTSVAIEEYKSEFLFEKPLQQFKIEGRLDGVKIPFIGYLDYYIPRQMVRDCKVVGRNPGKLSQRYIITASLYRFATGVDTVIYDLFVDNKKPVHVAYQLTDEEYKFGLSYAKRAMQVLDELQETEDPDRVFELMCFPNLESYFDEYEKKSIAEAWEIEMP